MPAVAVINTPGVLLYDADNNPIATYLDGADYKIETVTKHRNAAGTIFDPATEGTLATRATESTLATRASESTLSTRASEATLSTRATETTLASINAKDFGTETTLAALAASAATEATLANLEAKAATETTLASLETKAATETTLATLEAKAATETTVATLATQVTAAAIQTVLEAIRDTAGIKKITDPVSIKLEYGDKVVVAYLHEPVVTADSYFMLVDLSDAGGDYKHTGTSAVKVVSVGASILKSKVKDQWMVTIGVILDIDGTSAKIGWLDVAALYATDTSKNYSESKAGAPPVPFNLTLAGSDFAYIASGNIEAANTAVNTGITLNNVKGNAVTPAVGDVILHVDIDAGDGAAHVEYDMQYYVD